MMDTDPSGLVTMVFDGQAPNSGFYVIEEFATRRHGTLAIWAERLIHRCHVVDPAFGADDAMQDALFTLFRAMNDGKIGSFETEEELVKLLRHKLAQSVLHEQDRENTHKRRCADTIQRGRPGVVHHLDDEIEPIDPHAPRPDEQAIAAEAVERWLRLLDRHDLALRPVATRKADGFNHREIAAQLGISLSTVEHRLRMIRTILAPYDFVAD
jgi:RNA polymerase sigma factor (sigma-70 family)